jgi:hypothetical protein
MLRAALATSLVFALSACIGEHNQEPPQPCPNDQDTALYRRPLIEVGRVGVTVHRLRW